MKNTGTLKVTASGDREIVMTRVFDAPRGLVWEAHTNPELLKRWFFGPDGWSLEVCDLPLSVGSAYRYVWRGPDGSPMGMGGIVREIVPPERMVCTQLFDEDWTGGEAVGTLVLTERDGKRRSRTPCCTRLARPATRFSRPPWSAAWPRVTTGSRSNWPRQWLRAAPETWSGCNCRPVARQITDGPRRKPALR